MNGYFLDTSVIIFYTKGDEETRKLVDGLEGDLVSSHVCLSELYEGIFRSAKGQEIEQEILKFFKGLSEIYALDESIAREFGKLRAELKRSGNVIEDFDLLIAATCLVNNLTLVSGNIRHFTRIEGLKMYLPQA